MRDAPGFDLIIVGFRLTAQASPARVLERLLGLGAEQAKIRAKRFPLLALANVPEAAARALGDQLSAAGARIQVCPHDPSRARVPSAPPQRISNTPFSSLKQPFSDEEQELTRHSEPTLQRNSVPTERLADLEISESQIDALARSSSPASGAFERSASPLGVSTPRRSPDLLELDQPLSDGPPSSLLTPHEPELLSLPRGYFVNQQADEYQLGEIDLSAHPMRPLNDASVRPSGGVMNTLSLLDEAQGVRPAIAAPQTADDEATLHDEPALELDDSVPRALNRRHASFAPSERRERLSQRPSLHTEEPVSPVPARTKPRADADNLPARSAPPARDLKRPPVTPKAPKR